MKLKPFKEVIGLSKEKLDAAMAPIRARQVKSQAELEMAKLDADLLAHETEIQEMLTNKSVNFPSLMDKLDKCALLERRRKQYDSVLKQLFPEE